MLPHELLLQVHLVVLQEHHVKLVENRIGYENSGVNSSWHSAVSVVTFNVSNNTRWVGTTRYTSLVGRVLGWVHLRLVVASEKAGVALYRHCARIQQIRVLESSPPHVPLVPMVSGA
jgi:hypothetical protein